jgi:hypothetical protein
MPTYDSFEKNSETASIMVLAIPSPFDLQQLQKIKPFKIWPTLSKWDSSVCRRPIPRPNSKRNVDRHPVDPFGQAGYVWQEVTVGQALSFQAMQTPQNPFQLWKERCGFCLKMKTNKHS